jgi:CheY-like chemotaxis protein/HPt (histidine-containing phosphotransfer) domain-containing protein
MVFAYACFQSAMAPALPAMNCSRAGGFSNKSSAGDHTGPTLERGVLCYPALCLYSHKLYTHLIHALRYPSQPFDTILSLYGPWKRCGWEWRSLPGQCIHFETLEIHMSMEAIANERHILLVDDEPTNQTLGALRLKKLGWKADIAANGYEALERLQQKSYDLILMDCHMPEMDGFTAATAIRTSDPQKLDPRIPIIAMTAGSMKDYQLCLAAGMDDFISKLATTDELAAKLEYWIKKSNRQKYACLQTVSPETRPIQSLQQSPAASPTIMLEKAWDAEANDLSIFNEAEFLKRLMDDPILAKMIVNAFLHDMPGQIAELKGHVSNGDEENARRVAHGIRGASSNLAAHSLAGAIHVAEGHARQGDLMGMSLSIPEIEMEFEHFVRLVHRRDWME